MPALIVDCYGTLVDEPDLSEAFAQAVPHSRRLEAKEVFERTRRVEAGSLKLPFRTQRDRFSALARLALNELGMREPAHSESVSRIMKAFAEVSLAPHCWPFLIEAGRLGPVVMASNADNGPIANILLKLPNVFTAVITSESVGAYKPNPRVLNAAVEATGHPPTDCVVLGDDPLKDIAPAEYAGCTPILLGPHSSRYAGHSAHNLQDAIAIVRCLFRMKMRDRCRE